MENKKITAEVVVSPSSHALPGILRGFLAVWLFHWVTAILIVFILATSITSSLGLTNRAFGLRWTEIHLSAGLLILFFVIVRLLRSSIIKPTRIVIPTFWRRKVKAALLVLSLLLPVSGLLIFQQPPLSKPVQIFGAVPFPAIFDLDHSVHMTLISSHKMGSYLLLGVLLVHIALAIIKPHRHSKLPLLRMLWPWADTPRSSRETRSKIR